MRHPDERDNYLDAHRRNEMPPIGPEWTCEKWLAALDAFRNWLIREAA